MWADHEYRDLYAVLGSVRAVATVTGLKPSGARLRLIDAGATLTRGPQRGAEEGRAALARLLRDEHGALHPDRVLRAAALTAAGVPQSDVDSAMSLD